MFNSGLIKSKLLSQYQSNNCLETTVSAYLNTTTSAVFLTISINASSVSIQPAPTPTLPLLNNSYFIYNNSGSYYLYQYISASTINLITNITGNAYYCIINNVLYMLSLTGLLTPIPTTPFIYFSLTNYYIFNTDVNGNLINMTANTINPPYINNPYLLSVSNFINTNIYPSDSTNNTLLNYNNNIININNYGIISINTNNFITDNNNYSNGIINTNLQPGLIFTCLDGLYIRDVTNTFWNTIMYL